MYNSADFSELLRQDNAMNEIKLEDEYEYIITLMRQDSSVESLREKLPQALEALDKIKQEYRRFYDESMEETRSFDTGMRSLLYSIEQVIFTRLDLGSALPKAPTPTEGEAAPPPEEAKEEEELEEHEEEPADIVYDDEEQTVGEEYDYVTLTNDRRLYVQDVKHPQHAHDLVGILVIPHKLPHEIEGEERLKREAEEEAAEILAANGGAPPGPEPEEEEEEGKEKFKADAMVSPQNPFSAFGNEPLLEVLEIPVSSLIAVRRTQRRALLEYKTEQDDDIIQDTDAVVKDEQETLTVQLDERLRQWAPRPGRAEMDVYEVRDTQLHQHHSKKDRHVGALSMRAAVQQAHFTSLIAAAEKALKEHKQAQQVRIKALDNATNTSQLSNYERLAKLNDFEFKDGAKARHLHIQDFSYEALAGLKKMNKLFIDGCYLFEELGGPAGKNGNYNPEEIEEYKMHLSALDADATERTNEWIKYAEGLLERHNGTAKDEIDKFYEAMKNVSTDISLLEAVDKEVRTCSLMQQQLLSSHDALVETLDSKIVQLEALCAGASHSAVGSNSATMKTVQLGDEEEEHDFQENPTSINILQTLYSIRWRILDRTSFMQCLQSQLEIEPLGLLPPPTPPQEACPENLQEVESLVPLRNILWVQPPEEAGDEESQATEPAPRFTKLGKTDERPTTKEDAPANFQAGVDRIQDKQKAALEALVANYFAELGDREITRKEGDPACTTERFIPPDVDAFNEKNAARLAELRISAMEAQKNKVRYLRSVVARISTVLGKVPSALFLNVADRARRRAKVRRTVIDEAFHDDKKSWGAVREEHSVKLKPSLGNSNARQELDDLCASEETRNKRALEMTDAALFHSLLVEAEESWSMFNEYQWSSEVLLKLLDTTVQPADLVPTDEDVIAKRKTLLTLMREHAKKEDGTEKGPPPEGKAFHPKTFRGLRKGELGAPALFSLVEQLEKDPSFTAKKALAVTSDVPSDPVQCNDSANHATAIKNRDRSYNHFRLNFATQVLFRVLCLASLRLWRESAMYLCEVGVGENLLIHLDLKYLFLALPHNLSLPH
jgi:hypothetical protein